MLQTLIAKYATPVPRYTSFPTAPHFNEGVGQETYRQWLSDLPQGREISLYAHIPYCDSMCWFCGCHTKITKSYGPIESYIARLKQEISAVGETMCSTHKVNHIHWGGGSPTILDARHIDELASLVAKKFSVNDDTQFAVEIDPRGMTKDTIEALADAGVNRASLGVQDFDGKVQMAINRVQTYKETARVIAQLRDAGVKSINVDILYGLPYQTCASIEKSVHQVLTLAPDRIALFGYAHVPWMKKHQKMIDEQALPSNVERFVQARHAAEILTDAGFMHIGIDHFAKPSDSLAKAAQNATLKRNFQGYTTDTADALIGFGASAISKLPQGYVQNIVPIAEYNRRIDQTGMATEKGLLLSADDRLRAYVIEKLMCELSFSREALMREFGTEAAPALRDAATLVSTHSDKLIAPNDDGFSITEKGRPFMRSICAHFDPYLETYGGRHSVAI